MELNYVYKSIQALIHNIQELFLSNIQKEHNVNMRNRNAYSLEFEVCKLNHLDQKSCIYNENKSAICTAGIFSQNSSNC